MLNKFQQKNIQFTSGIDIINEEKHDRDWKSKAVLQALDSVRRDDIFKSLRKANAENSIAKRFASLTAKPLDKKSLQEMETLEQQKKMRNNKVTMTTRLPQLKKSEFSTVQVA